MAKNTARRPNIHWFMEDLRANGFAENFEKYCEEDTILGLYLPETFLRAWMASMDPTTTDVGRKLQREIMANHPPELTIRKNDAERTLIGHYNESHVCPPDCS
jgi:hypothetical protein